MGTLSLVAPLVLFEKKRLRAGIGFHLLPSFHHHPTQHNYTTQTVTHTVTLISTSYSRLHYKETRPICNVVCPSGAWLENRPHLTPSIRLTRNPKHVIVQWVGIGKDRQNLIAVLFFHFGNQSNFCRSFVTLISSTFRIYCTVLNFILQRE